MSTNVSIKDVAEAAGVSKSTVSRVINGMGKATRISPTTQARVLAVAHQLGYQTNLLAQNISLGKGISHDFTLPVPDRTTELAGSIGLILSASTSPDALGLIPGLEPILATAHYRLVVITVPADPATGQARLNELLNAGIAGIICCSTVYPAVLKTVAGTRPVIVLWAGAAKAMIGILNGESVETGTPNKPAATPVTSTPPPVAAHTVTPITPKPTPTPPAPQPQPVIIPKPVIVTPVPVLAPKPATVPEPILVPELGFAEKPTPAVPLAPPSEPVREPASQVLPQEPEPPVTLPSIDEPIPLTPAPEMIETPEPVITPEPTPIIVPEPTSVPTPEPEPITSPEPVIVEEPAPTMSFVQPAEPIQEPMPQEQPTAPEPTVDVPPIVEPIPIASVPEIIATPEPVIAPEPTPIIIPELMPVAPPSQQESPPATIPEPVPVPAPEPIEIEMEAIPIKAEPIVVPESVVVEPCITPDDEVTHE